jgi:hypothetical protein
MTLNEKRNIMDWMTDAWTSSALDNRESFGVAMAQLCKQYLLCHGGDPKVRLDMLAEIDTLYNILRKGLIKNGHPDNFKE